MPTSVQQQIEDAVVKLILSASIPNLDTEEVNVVRRELPETIDEDPSKLCIVVVGNERMPSEAEHDKRTNVSNIFEYPVLVLLSHRVGLVQPRPDKWKREARYAIRQVLFRQFLLSYTDPVTHQVVQGVARRCKYIPEPEINTTGFQRDVKVSGQMFMYRCEEDRVV